MSTTIDDPNSINPSWPNRFPDIVRAFPMEHYIPYGQSTMPTSQVLPDAPPTPESTSIANGIFYNQNTRPIGLRDWTRTLTLPQLVAQQNERQGDASSGSFNPRRFGSSAGILEQLPRTPKYTHDHQRFTIRVEREAMPYILTIVSNLQEMECTELEYAIHSDIITGVTLHLLSSLEAIQGVEKATGEPAMKLKRDLPGIDGSDFDLNIQPDFYTQTRIAGMPELRMSDYPPYHIPPTEYNILISPSQRSRTETVALRQPVANVRTVGEVELYQQLLSEMTTIMRDRIGISDEPTDESAH